MWRKLSLTLTGLSLMNMLGSAKPTHAQTQAQPPDSTLGKETLVQHHAAKYAAYGRPDSLERSPGSHTWAIHLEELGTKASVLRHGEAAADILDTAADTRSRRNIPVHLIDSNILEPSPVTRAALAHADVVGVSQEANLSIDYKKSEVDSIWKASDAIIVVATGNDGERQANPQQRQNHSLLQRADTILRVGAVEGDKVAGYSSRNTPSFVADNPFTQGHEYKLIKDIPDIATQLRADWEEKYDSFYQQIHKALLHQAVTDKMIEKQLVYSRDNLQKVENQLLEDKEFLEVLGSQVKGELDQQRAREFQKAINEADALALHYGRDEEGFSTNIAGTSFVAPHVAGEIAAQHEKYPQLTEQDLVVAALLAASENPITAVEGSDKPLEYKNNGRGIKFNATHTGFGHFKGDVYAEQVKKLASLAQENPGLSTKENITHSTDIQEISIPNNDTMLYKMQVNDDVLSIRTMLHMNFSEERVPETITLLDPNGVEFTLAPAVATDIQESPEGIEAEDFATGKASASTDAFLGNNAKGTWFIKIPHGYTLENAEITVAGVKPGGLIDAFIEQEVGPEKKSIQHEKEEGHSLEMPSQIHGGRKQRPPILKR